MPRRKEAKRDVDGNLRARGKELGKDHEGPGVGQRLARSRWRCIAMRRSGTSRAQEGGIGSTDRRTVKPGA